MKTLVLGGVKSGKSRFAESLAGESQLPVTYVATATAGDEEMQRRIDHHRRHRPSAWRLIEEPVALGRIMSEKTGQNHCLLVDCLTLWLSNCLVDDDETRFDTERASLLDAMQSFSGTLIMVSNETNLGVVPMGTLSRRFCDEAGLLHQQLAGLCDQVVVTMAGLPLYLKSNRPAR